MANTARASRTVTVRLALLSVFIVFLFVAVLTRAVQLQIVEGPRYAAAARDQYLRAAKLSPRRGPILDRTGAPLAMSIDVDSIYADPSAMKPSEKAVLARALHLTLPALEKTLGTHKHFVWLRRKTSADEAERIRALKLAGVLFVKESRRVYPQGALAGHLLGYSTVDGDGVAGVEGALDTQLRGLPLEVLGFRDARGETELEDGAPDSAETAGATVQLTIDRAIQHATERALKSAVTGALAKGGAAVVLDPKTGALLAVASEPAMDPNAPGRESNAWRDRAVADAVEPGSTVKTFVIAAALEEGVVKPTDLFDAENGNWTFGRRHIHDTHPHGRITVSEIVKYSSNIGAAKIGLALGKERLTRYLHAFGFGERAGLGLPGEGHGAVHPAAGLADIAAANMSFGQGMSATAVQLAAAMGVIASGGVLRRPYLVQRVISANGKVQRETRPEEERRVISESVAAQMTSMLEGVVATGGTGARAAMADFRVAGKTGTAQKAENGVYGGKLLASFLGFAPADAPRVVVLVMIDEPNVAAHYGGDVAAPAFAQISREALRAVGVLPPGASDVDQLVLHSNIIPSVEYTKNPIHPQAVSTPTNAVIVPNLKGLTARAATKVLSERQLEAELSGSGHTIAQQPRAGAIVSRGAHVHVTLAPQI